jgi:hypothetical protein
MASQDNTVTAVPPEPRPAVATEETSAHEPPSAPEKATTEPHLAPESSQQATSSTSATEKATEETINSAGNASLEAPHDETRAASSSTATTAMDTTNNALASDMTNDGSKEVDEEGPSLVITLLLITGARHPFKIDSRYLRKRAVTVENNDPFNMSVYTLKELIWREWRSGKFFAFFTYVSLLSLTRNRQTGNYDHHRQVQFVGSPLENYWTTSLPFQVCILL